MTAAHVIGNSADFLDPFFLFSRRQPAARRAASTSDPGGIVPRFRLNPDFRIIGVVIGHLLEEVAQ